MNKWIGSIILAVLAVCSAAEAGTVNEDNGANAICARSEGAIQAFIKEMRFLRKKMTNAQDRQAVNDRISEAKYCLTHHKSTDEYLRKADGMKPWHE